MYQKCRDLHPLAAESRDIEADALVLDPSANSPNALAKAPRIRGTMESSTS